MANGFIKLHRNLLDNPISSKPEYAWLWVTLLLKANHKNIEMIFNNQKVHLKSGQFITGRKQLSAETGISESKIYRILKYLEIEHQIEQQPNNKYTTITILNWEKYQNIEQQNKQPVNNQRTTSEQPVNTNKNDKNEKNDKNILKEINKEKKNYTEFVFLTDEEYQKLINLLGDIKTQIMIDKLNNYIGSKGKKYKSHYYTILNWVKMEEEKNVTSEPKTLYKKV